MSLIEERLRMESHNINRDTAVANDKYNTFQNLVRGGMSEKQADDRVNSWFGYGYGRLSKPHGHQ